MPRPAFAAADIAIGYESAICSLSFTVMGSKVSSVPIVGRPIVTTLLPQRWTIAAKDSPSSSQKVSVISTILFGAFSAGETGVSSIGAAGLKQSPFP